MVNPPGSGGSGGVTPPTNNPTSSNDEGSQEIGNDLSFGILPVQEVIWVGWYGGTNFAYQDHLNYINKKPNYNYDGYCQGYHCGLDLGGNWGSNVNAGISGTVIGISSRGGNYVNVKTSNGYVIRYQHLSSINVALGDQVIENSTIGQIGNPVNIEDAGNYHLHLEVRRDIYAINPLKFFSSEMIGVLQSQALEYPLPSNTFPSGDPYEYISQPDILLGGPVLWP